MRRGAFVRGNVEPMLIGVHAALLSCRLRFRCRGAESCFGLPHSLSGSLLMPEFVCPISPKFPGSSPRFALFWSGLQSLQTFAHREKFYASHPN